jgi:hypothetical protein
MTSGPDQLDMTGRVFFHGTSKRNARRILREGLRDWSWTAETPMIKHLSKRGIDRLMHGGSYGCGTYVTCNWRSALFFGPVLFRLELQPGTRLVRIDLPPDGKVLDSLKREFGKEILARSPWKVMPSNKRLTLDEAIQLARHHVTRYQGGGWSDPRAQKHEKLMFDMRNILVRYGIQGWGEPSDIGGIVIFATDRLKVREVVLSLPTENLLRGFRDTTTAADRHPSLEAMARSCLTARNRGADNTRKWVEEANQELEGKLQLSHSRESS